MSRPKITATEHVDAVKRGLVGGVVRGLGLMERLPELLKRRGWAPTEDLVGALTMAIVCTKLGSGGQKIKRPASAPEVWPLEPLGALQIIEQLELYPLLDPR